jgi:hypothetical protein
MLPPIRANSYLKAFIYAFSAAIDCKKVAVRSPTTTRCCVLLLGWW